MIHNPNPKIYRIRKLRERLGETHPRYVLVPISVIRRRKRNKKILSPIDNKTKLGRPKTTRRHRLVSHKFFE